MSDFFTCPQGHSWPSPGADGSPRDNHAQCPVCGEPGAAGGAGQPVVFPAHVASDHAALTQKASGPRSSTGPTQLPTVVGYEILGELGRGGMGVVYKARQLKLNRVVALKMILAGAHASPQDLARFRLEAEAAARLQHPNIVHIYEVNEQDGCPYISLEFVDGPSLAEKYAGTPQSPRLAAGTIEVLARAMHYAHEQGIVHRDLKPANVLLTPDGTPKVTDFGLAKKLEGGSGQTRTGAVLGTPCYMAPEQAAGKVKEIGPATDVYALGVLLYELLTGRPPFQAGASFDVVLQVISDEPLPPSRFQPKLPRDLETICLKCLQKDPARRYASALALAEDLNRFLCDRTIVARRASTFERAWRWCRRNPVVAAMTASVALLLLLLAVGALVAAVWLNEERKAAVIARLRAEGAEADALEQSRAAHANEIRAVRAEEEGRQKLWQSYLAQARAGRFSGQPGQRFDGLGALALAAAIRPALELRNEAVGCLALPDLRTASEGEGPSEQDAGAWALDLSLGADGTVTVAREAGGTVLARLPSAHGKASRAQPGPGGDVLLVVHPQQHGIDTLVFWDWRRQKTLLTIENLHDRASCWSPDGGLYLACERDGRYAVYDVARGTRLRRARLATPPRIHDVALSPDGRYLACASLQTRPAVALYDLDTGAVAAELSHPAGAVRLAWRPDGRMLAVGGGDRSVYLWNMSTRRLHAAVPGAEAQDGLTFSRAGDLVVACGWSGTTQLIDSATGKLLVAINGYFRSGFLASDRWLRGGPSGWYEVAPGRECLTLDGDKRDFSVPFDFSPGAPFVAVAGSDGVRLHDVTTGAEVALLPVGPSMAALFHRPDGSLITYGSRHGLARWPVRPDPETAGHWRVGPPRSLGVSPLSDQYNWMARGPDSRIAVSDWGRNQVVVLDVDHPEERLVLPHHGARSVALSLDGRWVAAGTWKAGLVRVWNAQTGQRAWEYQTKSEAVHVAFSPCSRWLVLSLPREYRFYEAGSWKPGLVLPRAEEYLPGPMAFAPDGKLLAVCDTPRRLKLVRPEDGREVATLDGRQVSALFGLGFSPDGSRLGVASAGSAVWDLRAVRAALARMGLEGELPAYDVPRPEGGGPLTVHVEMGNYRPESPIVALPPDRPRREATPEQISTWVRALGGDGAEAAARALEEVGPAAVPELTRVARGGPAGLRRKVEQLGEKITLHEVVGARPLRLRVKDAPLPDVVRAIREQSGMPIELLSEARPGGPHPPVTLDLGDGVPFWEALDRLCQTAGLVYGPRYEAGATRLGIADGTPSHGLLAYRGPVRLELVNVSHSRLRNLRDPAAPRQDHYLVNFSVGLEPRAGLLALGSPRLIRAEDDTGRRLEGGSIYGHWQQLPADLFMPYGPQTALSLRPASPRTTSLKHLHVALPLEVEAVRRDLLTVEDLDNAAGKTFGGMEGARMVVQRVQVQGAIVTVHLRLTGGEAWGDNVRRDLLELIDSRGRRYRTFPALREMVPLEARLDDLGLLAGAVQTGFPAHLPWTSLALRPGRQRFPWLGGTVAFSLDAPLRPPLKLILYTARRVQTELPFEFRDVPLP